MDRHLFLPIHYLVVALILILVPFFVDFDTVQASPLESRTEAGFLQSTPVPDDPVATPSPQPEPSPTPAPNPISRILHVISFDASDSLLAAWTRVLQRSQDRAAEDLEPVLEEAARRAADGFLQFTSKGLGGLDTPNSESSLYGAVKELWSGVFSVAGLFFPLAVLMNLAAVMVSGVSAPLARAEMLEALIRSLVVLGISAGSFLLTGTMIKIAWGAAEVVGSQPVAGSGSYLQELFVRLVLAALNSGSLESMLTLFLSLTLLFLALLAISALVLSYFAVLTLTVSLVALAPLLIVLGSLPYFRWIYATWIRAFVGVLLIPLANALLFRMWLVFTAQGENLVDILVGLGFICILVTVNFYVGKLVFSPVLEAGKLAFDSIVKLVQMTAIAAGLAIGGAGLGTAGGMVGGLSSMGRASPPSGPSGTGTSGGGMSTNNLDGFQERVEHWQRRSPEERQATLAGLERESFRVQAAGQAAQALAGRDPLLKAVGGIWASSRRANLAYERAAIHATNAVDDAQHHLSPINETIARDSPAISPSNQGAGNTSSQLHPGADSFYPVLFGNPAYDDQLLQSRGWSLNYRQGLHQNIHGLFRAAEEAASQSGLPDAHMIYDPLLNREVRVPGTEGQNASIRITPELFQASAVRISAGWLSQASSDTRLPGASILDRRTALEVLEEVADQLPGDPLGVLSRSILDAGEGDPGNLPPGVFWNEVVSRFRRENP